MCWKDSNRYPYFFWILHFLKAIVSKKNLCSVLHLSHVKFFISCNKIFILEALSEGPDMCKTEVADKNIKGLIIHKEFFCDL